MRRAARRIGATLLVVVLAGGAYATADAYDVVPGLITLAPEPEPPEPFPTAPGAVAGPDPAGPLEPLDAGAPVPAAHLVTELVLDALGDDRLSDAVSVVVADYLTGEVLADVGGEVPREPASTTKLFTALAALSSLGPDHTFRTRVVRDGPGRIVLVGGGDMMLAAEEGDPDAVNGRAGLADLAVATARALRLSGDTTVEVGLDTTLFSGPGVSPDWDPSYLRDGFTAPVSPLAVNIAKIRDEDYPPRHADPAAAAAAEFIQRLEDAGITVDGGPTRRAARDGAPEIAAVESAPLREVVEFFLRTSDNAITEAVGRVVAVERGLPGSFQGSTQAVLGQVAALGVDTSEVRLVDCSGLGAGSVIPARTLVELLRLPETRDDPVLRQMLRAMPIAALNGTLHDRYTWSDARGVVRAKTGSLPGVTSLAGTVLTAEGRLLVFAVMANDNPPGGQWGPRAVVDTLVSEIAGCDCTPPTGTADD